MAQCRSTLRDDHTDALSGSIQLDATIHELIVAKAATGFEIGRLLNHKRAIVIRLAAEPNSASCYDGRKSFYRFELFSAESP